MRYSYDHRPIRELRTRKGLPIEALALGVRRSVRTMQMWEHGRSAPSLEQLAQLCEVLEVAPCVFFEEKS